MDADEPGRALGGGKPALPRRRAQVHRGGLIFRKKPPEAVGVVVVAVGQCGPLHTGQVYPQLLGIVGELPRRPGVQQDAVPPVLDVEGQAVLRCQVAGGGVFHQNRNVHG